jgi:hypothetical protein
MNINCKNIYSESSKVDKYTEVIKGSVTAPPVDSVRLYNRSGNNLAIIDDTGTSAIVATSPIGSIYSSAVYYSQVYPQLVLPTVVVYGASLLDSVTSGNGSLTFPAGTFANNASFELLVSGEFTILANAKLINFGVFLDGALHREGKSTASLIVSDEEAFTSHIYLSCRDQGDGNVILYPTGKITVSGGGNLSVTPLTGLTGNYLTPIPINQPHTIDYKSAWTANDGDSISTHYVSLKRLS